MVGSGSGGAEQTQEMVQTWLAYTQGENILQIMHCWHYGQKVLIKSMKLNDSSYCLGMVLQADAYGTDHDAVGGFHKSWSRYFITMSCISFMMSRSCNGLCWFPHYAWDE